MIKELMRIKREQLKLEHKQYIVMQRIVFELKEIKAFLELTINK